MGGWLAEKNCMGVRVHGVSGWLADYWGLDAIANVLELGLGLELGWGWGCFYGLQNPKRECVQFGQNWTRSRPIIDNTLLHSRGQILVPNETKGQP